MKHTLWAVFSSAFLMSHAAAQEDRYIYHIVDGKLLEKKKQLPGVLAEDHTVRPFGMSLGASIPAGLTPGLSFHPGTNGIHFDLTCACALSLGVRGAVTIDPIDEMVAPTLTFAGGHVFKFAVPHYPDATASYSFFSVMPGIELGRRSRFRVFLRGGWSRLWFKSSENFLQHGTQAHGFIDLFPAAELGFVSYF